MKRQRKAEAEEMNMRLYLRGSGVQHVFSSVWGFVVCFFFLGNELNALLGGKVMNQWPELDAKPCFQARLISSGSFQQCHSTAPALGRFDSSSTRICQGRSK